MGLLWWLLVKEWWFLMWVCWWVWLGGGFSVVMVWVVGCMFGVGVVYFVGNVCE